MDSLAPASVRALTAKPAPAPARVNPKSITTVFTVSSNFCKIVARRSRPVLKKRDTNMVRRKTDPPRGVLKTAVSDRQRYRHARYHPSRDLERYVEHYWVVEWDLRGEAPERPETLPHPSVHMIFERDGKSRIGGAARKKFSTVLEGKGGVFAVKFTPGGFYPFVGVP